jgi:hypothetical protein
VTPDPIEERLSALHRVACEDALFAVASVGLDALEAFGKRRLSAAEAIARDGLANAVMMADWDAWRIALTKAIAPVAAPWFVPMRDAIDKGLTMEKESRGLRGLLPGALFGGDSESTRVRRDGAFAVRVARAVSAADGVVSRDEAFAVELLLAALALPEDDQRVLRAEAPIPIAAIELPAELEPKVARAVVAGAWQTAATDGLDDAEHAAVQSIAMRIGVEPDALVEAREDVEKTIARQRAIGAAMIDVSRYVLAPLPSEESVPLTLAAIHLAVPPLDREPAIRLVTTNAATPLGRAHDLDRAARTQVLSATWAAALATNPTSSSRARLVARHDRAAQQVGGERQAEDARDKVEDYIARAMGRGAANVGA